MASFTPYAPTAQRTPVAAPPSTIEDPEPKDSGPVKFSDPADPTAVRIGKAESFMQLDTDPTGAHTVEWGKMNNCGYDFYYVKSANVFGKTMSREQLEKTERGRQLIRTMEANRRGEREDFWSAIGDVSWRNFVPYMTTIAKVGGEWKAGKTALDTFRKIGNGEAVSDDEAIAARLYLAEQQRQENATWGHTVGEIVADTPSFMFEFGISGKALGAARKGAVNLLSKTGSARALSHVGLARTTKILADEAADDVVKAVVKTVASETAETAGTQAGLRTAASTVRGSSALRRDMVKSVADTVEKAMLSEENALLTGSERWGAGLVRKTAEARAEQAVSAALKRSAGGRVGNAFRALGKSLGDGASRGLLDAGSWGTEASTVLFTDRSTAGRALTDALTTFFVEAPLRGAEMYLARQGVTYPVDRLMGGTASQAELSLTSAAALNRDRDLMEKAHAISMGLDFLEYVSENTGRGFRSLGRAGILKFAPKFAAPASRVAGGMRTATAKLTKNEAGELTGVVLDGIMEEGRGAEAGGIINRFVRKVMGSPDDVRANTLADQTTATIAALKELGVDARNTAALQATIREGVVQPGLSREVTEALGGDVRGFVDTALKKAYRQEYAHRVEGLKLRSFQQFWAADFMARHKIGPETASRLFEKMGYDGVIGEMLEERYSDVASELFGLNGEKDQSLGAKLGRSLKTFTDWGQLTAEAAGFAFPMVARAGAMRALRAIGGGNEYTEFRDTAALYLDGTRHGAVGQWRYGDYLVGHAKAVRAEQAKHDAAVQRRAEVSAQRPADASDQWDAENLAPIDEEIARTEKAVRRMNERHERYLASLTTEERTGYSHLVNVAPLTTEDAELPDEEYNRKIAATNQQARQALSAGKVLTSRAAKMGQVLYKLDSRMKDETSAAFRKIAHWAVKVGAALATGDAGILSANPAEWAGVDRGLPQGIQIALRQGYERIFKEELRRDQQARSSRAGYETTERGHTFQADMDAAHERALARFDPVARRLMAESLAAHQARMFSNEELMDAATAEVARSRGLKFDERTREFVDANGARQSLDSFLEANRSDVTGLRNRMAVNLYETLASGSLENGRIVFNRTRDDANPVVDVIDIPKNLPTEEQAVVAAVMRRIPGMRGVLEAQELDGDKPVEDQLGGPGTRQEWLDELVSATLPDGQITADSVAAAQANVASADPVTLENIARDLNFQYDGTEEDLDRRNREIVELAVLSKALGDPNVRTYSREGALSEGDPAASPWTDYVSARRRADGKWTYRDEAGRSQVAADEADLDAKMAAMDWSPVTPRVVFTHAKVLQSDSAQTMLRALGLMRQYKGMMERAVGEDVNYKDPLFREGTETYNNPDAADRVRAEEKALSDLFERNSRQSGDNAVKLYLKEGERADDAAAMARARALMERAQAAYYRRNDETRGYAKLADDLLRRSGVSVPFSDTGVSVGTLNSDLRGKYSISLSAFRARRQAGVVYVSIDHGIAQNYKQSLLSAILLDAYARNKRLLASVFDAPVREFMDGVNRVAKAAQESASDPELARNLADFRAATVDHEQGTVRRPSPATMSLLIRAFALYQTEHEGNLKSVLGDYAPACREIAKAVRSLPSFQAFVAVVDRMFGGAGLNAELIERNRRNGTENATGLARLYAMFAPQGSPTLRDAIQSARPGGLSVDEFMARVAEADSAAMRSGLQRQRQRSNRPQQQQAPASPTTVLNTAQQVVPQDSAEEDALRAVMDAVPEADTTPAPDVPTPVPAVPAVSQAEQAVRERLDAANHRVDELHAAVEGGDTSEATADELRNAEDERELLESVAAVDNAPVEEQPLDGANAIVDDEEDEEPVETDDYYFVGGDGSVVGDEGTRTDADGRATPVVLKDRTELTDAEIRGLVPVLAKMARAIVNNDNIDADEQQFSDFLKRLVPGIRDVDLGRFVGTYAKMDEKARKDEFEDLWTFAEDDVEEGTEPDGSERGNDKTLAALQSKALQNFLAFAQLVNPLTGRQLQGYLDDLRNTVERSLVLDPGNETLKFVDGLVNPRANQAQSATVRDAYFAETLSRFTTDEGLPETRKHLYSLLMAGDHPLNRKAGWLLGYLAAMPPAARRQMTLLVSSAAPSSPVRLKTQFINADGLAAGGRAGARVVFMVEPRTGNASRVSTAAISAPFREFSGMSAGEIRKKADALLADAEAMAKEGRFSGGHPLHRRRGNSLYGSMAELFERHFGADSALVSVLSSRAASAHVERSNRDLESYRSTFSSQGGEAPFLVQTLVNGLRLMADLAGNGKAGSREAELAAVLTFTHGDPKKGGLTWQTNTSRVTDQLASLFRAFETVMPQTILTAETDPERTNQPASSIAITLRGIEPAVQVFMDRLDERGFRKVCERFFPQFARLDDAEKRRVLGICRQQMCWPTALRDRIVAKSLSKSAYSKETYLGCEAAYDMGNELAKAVAMPKGAAQDKAVEDIRRRYGALAVAQPVSYDSDGNVRLEDDNTFYVPVFSGDHSSSILLSVPLRSQFAGKSYEKAAEEVASWVGLDLLGVDAKRSATTSLEAPGVGFIGLKHNPDGSVVTNDDGTVQTGECRVNIVWSADGDNESMLGTTLGTGYGIEQLKRCAKDPNSSTLKFHAMNVSNTGTYGAHLSLLKSLNVGMGQENDKGEFGAWDPKRKLMDFIRKQRSSDFRDSTSLLTDFDSIKLAIANSKMMGVSVTNAKGEKETVPLMEWFFGKLKEKLDSGAALQDSYEGDELDALFADEANPDGRFEWTDLAMPERSGRKKLSEILDGARLDAVEGLAGRTYSLSYRDNDLMGFTVANVSHRASTRERGSTHYGRTPRNNIVDSLALSRVVAEGWNADGAAGTRIFTHLAQTAESLQDLVSRWGAFSAWVANHPDTYRALRGRSEDAQNAAARGEPETGRFMKDIMNKELAAYLRSSLRNVPMKGIDAPLVSNLSWVENGEAKTHSDSQMFRDTLQGSRTIPKRDRAFMRAHRRMALCSVNCTDASFRYGLYLDEEKLESVFGGSDGFVKDLFGDSLAYERLDGTTATEKTIAALDVIFTRLRDLEAEMRAESGESDLAVQVDGLRRRIASVFKDHHGNYMDTRRRTFSLRAADGTKSDGSANWYAEVSYDDLFTGLVRDAGGKRTFDRSAVYENMHDEKGEAHIYLGGTMMGLPRTPSYNGSMWLQTVRAALPCTESGEGAEWKAGYDAMVAPDPFTLKILGCDHDGDKTKLYMLEAPSLGSDARGKGRELRDADRFLDLSKSFDELADNRREHIKGTKKAALFEKKPKDTTLMQANNSFVQCLFDMSRALPVMDNTDGSSPFYTGEYVEGGTNRGAVARGTKAALTATAKALEKAGVEGGASVAWDVRVTKAADVIGPKLLDPKTGKTIGRPLTAAEIGDGAQNAAEARGIVVSIARALHIAWASGVFDRRLFRGMKGAEAARQWLDFMYHLDGFSNMTFDDIKEQVCSRLGVTAGMMDTIVADMIVYGRDKGRLPQTDSEFIDAFVRYAKDVNHGGSRSYMRRATDKADYAMQEEIRRAFGREGEELSNRDVQRFFGLEYSEKGGWGFTGTPAGGAETVRLLREAAEELEKTRGRGAGKAALRNLTHAIATGGARRFGVLGGYLLYMHEKGDAAEAVRMLEWHDAVSALADAKAFGKSVNYTTTDPGAPSATNDAESCVSGWERIMLDREGNPIPASDLGISEAQLRRLNEMHDSTMLAYRMCGTQSVADYGRACVDAFEYNVAAICGGAETTEDAVLATKLIAAQRIKSSDRMAAEASAQMTGLSFAAMRSVRQVGRSKIGSHNIYDVLRAFAQGSGSVVRGKRPRNGALDMRRGIEDMFELMYRLVDISMAQRELPLFAMFSERPDSGPRGYNAETYYGDEEERAERGLGRITLAFQGVTEGQISEVRRMYDRAVTGRELDSDGALAKNRRGVYDVERYRKYEEQKKAAGETPESFGDWLDEKYPFTFTMSRENLEAFRKSRDYSFLQGRARTEMNMLIDEAEAVLDALEPVLGKGCAIEPSAFLGQILPVYAALTQRTDRVPDSRSSSIVTAMGDTYARWAAELERLDRDHGLLMAAVTGVDFSPLKRGLERELMRDGTGKPARRINGRAEYEAALDELAKRLHMRSAAELAKAISTEMRPASSRTWRDIRAALHQGAWQTGNPEGRYNIDIFGNNGLYRTVLESLARGVPKPASADRRVNDRVEPEAEKAVSVELPTPAKPEVPERDPYMAELAAKLNGILKQWNGAKVEYHGGRELFIRARLRGTAAERQNRGGVETMIRVALVDRVLDPKKSLTSMNWLRSNANRRSDVEGRKLTVEDVKAELDAMTEEQRIAYFEKWRPVGVTSTRMTSDWAVEPMQLGVLCREIRLEEQTKYPNVIFHEYFHAVFGMMKELGTFTEEDMAHLTKAFHDRKGRFSEEKAAEDFQRFVEEGAVPKDEKTLNVFQKLLDAVRALWEAITKTGVVSSMYGREMKENPLAAMILTGHAMTSATEIEAASSEDLDALAAVEGALAVDDGEADVSTVALAGGITNGDLNAPFTDRYVQGELFDLPPAEKAPMQALEARFLRAAKNMLGAWQTREAANSGDYPFDRLNGDTLQRTMAGLEGIMPALDAVGWQPGDSLGKIPRDVFDSRTDVEKNAIRLLSREGLMMNERMASELDDDRSYGILYRMADFLTDIEALTINARRYADVLRANGLDEARVKDAVKRQLAASGAALAHRFDAELGDHWGTRFRRAYRDFLTTWAPAVQATQQGGESMYDVEDMSPEERIEEQLDMVVPDRMAGQYSPQLTLARAVGMAVRNKFRRDGLDAEARDVLAAVGRNRERILRGMERAAAVDAVRQVAAQQGIDPASISGQELENLAFRAIVEMNMAPSGDRAQGPVNLRNGGTRETQEPYRATSSTLAGAIMAACGTTPAAIGEAVSRDLLALKARYAGSSFEAVLDRFLAASRQLESLDPTRLCEDPAFREETLGATLHGLEAGLVGGNLLPNGDRERYKLANAGTSLNPSFDANRALYGNHVNAEGNGNDDFQYAAHRVIDALYTVLAGMKFYRQLGFEPGDANAEALADAPAPNTPDQTAALLGVEARQLLEHGAEATDFYDQPYFVANNMDAWLESTVRKTFGHVDVGEFMRGMHNRHSGYMRRLVLEENWNAAVMGLDVLPGQHLAAVEEVQGKFSMDAGVVRRRDGSTYYRFVRYDASGAVHGQRDAKDPATGRKIALTENEARLCDLVLKADKVFAQGGHRIVTGVDKIRFSVDDVASEEHYSRENVKARRDSGREFSDFDRALWRLDLQLGGVDENGLNPQWAEMVDPIRERFVRTAVSALQRAKRMDSTKDSSEATTDYVLNELEKAGVAIGHERFNPVTDRKMYESGVLVLDIDELEDTFRSSSAREKLLAAGRREEWLTRQGRVEPFMRLYREVAAYVRTNPWLTDGDGAFFNNFRTALPFMQGQGVFMYNANRKARGTEKTPAEKMTAEETVFKNVMAAYERSRNIRPATEMSDDQARLVAKVFGMENATADQIRTWVGRGDYAPGSRRARETGLALRADANCADVTKAVYDRLVEAAWAGNGDPVAERVGGMSSVARMIDMYEEKAEADMAIAGGVGATDEMVYRTSGVLPANAQLGHAIHNAIEGITNALAFRSTLVNMLMAPDAQGRPTCYADPNLLATEAGGVPDAVWSQVARWWASSNGLKYDEGKSGIANAHEIYKTLHDEFSTKKTIGGVAFGEIAGEDIDAKSITGFMAQSDPKDSKLNVLAGGYALGYARHLLQSSRNLGSTAQRAVIHRALAYSKSLSVSFSMFFPLATKWESPIGAVGAVAALGSNLAPDFLRRHAEAAGALQKMFSGNGWITNDFLGFRDVVKMMDSNDPFLSELVGWASALGIQLSDSRVNPLEPQRAIVQRDLRQLTEMVRGKFGAKAAARIDSVMRTMLTRSGDKAFTYALNATKLATTAQICMKLRQEAERQGKAFDPVRDLKRYSGYINAEIGGIDPLKYAWAHPMNRGLMNMLMFSWEWTRGAWEAGGGGAVEDLLLGGHTMTAEERKYIVGRWARMFGAVMIGVPMLFQLAVYALSRAMGRDDDDDKMWTFQNEDKACWTAFDLTPLLRAMSQRFPTVAQWKKDHPVLSAMLPMYTGDDRANRTHGSFDNGRRYYMHFGKQGWEFFRWFQDAPGQFFSKLSMPLQRILEGVFGRNLSWMDRELPWNDMGAAERWLSLSPDSATVNMVKAFLPFTLSGFMDRGDVGVLSAVGPIQMGDSDYTVKEKMKKELKRWAFDERGGLKFAVKPPKVDFKFRIAVLDRDPVLVGLYRTARINGNSHNDAVRLVDSAVQGLVGNLYNDLLEALPDRVDGDFDPHRIGKLCRAARRLGRKHSKIVESLQERVEKRGHKLDPKLRELWSDLTKQGMAGTYEPPVRRKDY